MKMVKVLEDVGYGLVNLGVEEVMLACVEAALPTRRVPKNMKVLRTIGKYAISTAAAKKVTEAIQEDVEELKVSWSKKKPEKKVQN